MSMRFLDVSNHQGEITAAQVAGWVAAGYPHVCVRASLESQALRAIARRQMQAVVDGGAGLSAYVWTYFTADAPEQVVADALGEYGDLPIRSWWVDVEDTGYAGAVAHNVQWLQAHMAAWDRSVDKAGIYSAAWYWDVYLDGSAAFTDRPLWAAVYDSVPDLSVWQPFGGWTALAAKQYRPGEASPLGVDENVGDPFWFPPAEETPMPEPTRRYSPDLPAIRQMNDWSCSVASTAWALQSLGIDAPYPALANEMIAMGLVSRADGLLRGDGSGLWAWLRATYGLDVERAHPASYEWVHERAGRGPILIGGASLNHWVAVRGLDADGGLRLMNPAVTWRGIGDDLDRGEWDRWGNWACIWIAVQAADDGPEEEDMARIQELEAQLAECVKGGTAAVADIENASRAVSRAQQYRTMPAAARRELAQAQEHLLSGARPAAATAARGGLPAEE